MSRIYNNWEQCYDEMKRNVMELGTSVELDTMQDKVVKGNPDFITKELIGESYKLVGVRSGDLLKYMATHNYSVNWSINEFNERVHFNIINPGEAWKHREATWKPFIHGGRFAYSYNERLRKSLNLVIDELKKHKTTRQAIVGMWSIDEDPLKFGKQRVPCSMYYQFLVRKNVNGEDELHIIYTMRSSDVITHFVYDVYLALRLQEYIANKVGILPGHFTHFIGSCHGYAKDLKGVF